MSHPPAPGVGSILSADIAVPEHARELAFYARVLTTGEQPLWRDDLMNNRGAAIIGLGERTAEYADLPLQWMPHIQVADVAVGAARAVELGGSELMHGRDDDGNSQWAVLRDPGGAAFGLIPVVPAGSLPGVDGDAGDAVRVGAIAGVRLEAADAPASRDFYRQVVGWTVRDIAVEDGAASQVDFHMFGEDGGAIARIRPASGQGPGLPPVWLLQLPVGDLAESLRRVREDGGEVLREPGAGDASAVIRDPVGACLALTQG